VIEEMSQIEQFGRRMDRLFIYGPKFVNELTAQFAIMRIITEKLRIISSLLESSRSVLSILASVLVYLFVDSWQYALVVLLFLFFSFLFNDLVDYEMDRVGHSNRALPQGRLTKQISLWASLVTLFAGFVIIQVLISELLLFFVILYSTSAFYSAILKHYVPAIATPIWSLIVTFLILYVVKADIWVYILVFSFFFARELLLDYRDKEADKIFSATKSLPNLLGNYTYWLVFLLLLIAAVSALFIGEIILVVLISIASIIVLLVSSLFKLKDKFMVPFLTNLLLFYFPLILLISKI